MKISGYQFESCFGPYIIRFIQEKRESGFIYHSEEWKLKHFDAFCITEGVTEPFLSRELVKKWGTIRDNEELVTCSARVSIIRQFGLYLTSLGMEAYIPSRFYKAAKKVVHILSDDEIRAVFQIIDAYVPKINVRGFNRLSMEYRILFRLIYCCGLRISEARQLRQEDVDLDRGTVRIMQSKGHKDRLVYLADDLAELLRTYKVTMESVYNCRSEWFFPAREAEKCLTNGTIGVQFRKSWAKTPYAAGCDRNPTVHCLRHSFVVKRMNLWMEEGISLKELLPFLSKYLGHASPAETFYYYHQIDTAFRIIRNRDKTGTRVIPEVPSDE